MRFLDRLHQESATLTASDAWWALAYAFGVRPSSGTDDAYVTAWSARLGGIVLPVASARGALTLALRASGVEACHEVVVTGFTCVAVPAAVMASGAKPVYADIDPNTGNVTPETVLGAISPRTKAVIVQHTLGNPAPTRAIRAVLPPETVVIEDAVHALGSTVEGHLVGREGDWAVFGTEHSKAFSTGQGGVLAAISDRAQAALSGLDPIGAWSDGRTRRWSARIALDRLAWVPRGLFGRRASTVTMQLVRQVVRSVSSEDRFERNGGLAAWRLARLPPQLAGIGLRQLKRLHAIVAHRRKLAGLYESALARGVTEGKLGLLRCAPDVSPVWLRYPVVVPDPEATLARMRRRGFELAPRWFSQVVYPPGTDLRTIGYVPGMCPGGEELAARILNLPTHPLIEPELAERVATNLLRVLQ